MQKLDDIVLRKGDIVYYDNGDSLMCTGILKEESKEFLPMKDHIVKIERPLKYETIYEDPKTILTEKEKEYLENVIRPFKDEIKCIVKGICFDAEFIYVVFNDIDDIGDIMDFPLFKKDTMYKGMECDKEYSLKELGLFEE